MKDKSPQGDIALGIFIFIILVAIVLVISNGH